MSRITELLRYVEKYDTSLAEELREEVRVLAERRSFGLNFERHVPETVELPHRTIRRGDKVRFLPPRGKSEKSLDKRLWLVTRVSGRGQDREAHLVEWGVTENPETTTRRVEDLVVVAEFRDPIYPGLRSTGKVEQGGDKPYHLVINAENYHALEALLFAYEGRIDCIYIDPPYNTRDKDWKYNNDYVDSDDAYKHSKWLAMMERRLKLAKRLLNPEESVLIVTIDEKEYLRLGLLLEQLFPAARVQMVTSVINPKGTARPNEFSRVEEYIFFVFVGHARVQRWVSDMLTDRNYADESQVRWRGLARTGRKGLRVNNPGSWYPIFLKQDTYEIHSIGDAIDFGDREEDVAIPEGCIAVWPPEKDGVQYSWGTVPQTLREIHKRGGLKTGRIDPGKGSFPFYYLTAGLFAAIDRGDIEVVGKEPSGALSLRYRKGARSAQPRTVWTRVSHDAGTHGTGLLQKFLPGRSFPFPKSLYAVEDTLRFFIGNKPNAIVLDFFAGSGTTAHAVMRLNRQDAGQRQAILVTNNEVSAEEAKKLRAAGHRPGDPEWEALGICEYITKPRILAAVTGRTPSGEPVDGAYKFVDEFPFADGFDENVAFFDLTYEDPERVRLDMAFSAIAPLLWLRAGSRGPRIEERSDSYALTDFYGVLFNVDYAKDFLAEVEKKPDLRVAYVITDEAKQYQMVAGQLPNGVEVIQLYESYLTTFEINSGRDLK